MIGTESDELERQARQARAQITGTLNELRGRMTPGQMVDQVADYAREGPAADFIRNLGREVRENPLPLTLIAAGIAWLIVASGRSARARARQFAIAKAAEATIPANADFAGRAAPATTPAATIGQQHPGYAAEIPSANRGRDQPTGQHRGHAVESVHEQP
jgi:Protein of unknown function (DUF3618)